jgi:hypothetical protein
MRRQVWIVLALLFATVPVLWAQASGGHIYGSVVDASGAVVPGATIALSGATIGGRTTQSDKQGDFRFLNLDPGTYKLQVTMSGFATVNRDVIVTTGQNVNLSFAMKVAGAAETVEVSAETPVVDTKRVGTATTMTKEELAQIPQSRDPWAVLKTVPGVLVDRVNVAGNESGQQSGFVSKGSLPSDTQWNLDGVVITDFNSNGASSSYYDFDAFDEINVSTGGGDLKVATGGIGINFVTKRGSNQFHGGARVFLASHKLQSDNTPAEVVPLTPTGEGPHTDQINDYGFDLGGPIVKDKLWFWGSYGKNDIRITRFAGTNDKTLLKNWNAKLNWQAGSNDMFSLYWFNGAKVKIGRDPGVVTNEPTSFLWYQDNFYPEEDCGMPCGLHGLWKAEWNHTFSSNFNLNAKYAYYGWGYGFDAGSNGGQSDLNGGWSFDTDTAYGAYNYFTARKPWHMVNVDGNYFVPGMGGQHEFKFGFGYRKNPARTTTTYAGNQVPGIDNGGGDTVAQIWRQRNVAFTENAWSGYFGDTFTKDRLTLSAGVRYDYQHAKNKASTAAANPLFPEILPELVYDGSGPEITWKDFSPRVSLSYALNQSRKTVARASYARYAGQLFPNDVTVANPVGGYYTYIAYRWHDANARPLRVEGRGAAERGHPLLHRRRSGQPDGDRLTQQDRPRLPLQPRQRDRGRDRSRARGQLRGGRRLHVAQGHGRLGLAPAHRHDLGRLHAARTGDGERVYRPGLLTRPGQDRRLRRRKHPHEPAGLQHGLQRPRADARQTNVQQVVRASGALLHGLAREPRSGRCPEPDTHRQDRRAGRVDPERCRRTAGGRRADRAALGRIGQGGHLLQRALAGRGQCALPAAGQLRDRDEHLRPAGLRVSGRAPVEHRR